MIAWSYTSMLFSFAISLFPVSNDLYVGICSVPIPPIECLLSPSKWPVLYECCCDISNSCGVFSGVELRGFSGVDSETWIPDAAETWIPAPELIKTRFCWWLYWWPGPCSLMLVSLWFAGDHVCSSSGLNVPLPLLVCAVWSICYLPVSVPETDLEFICKRIGEVAFFPAMCLRVFPGLNWS